MTRLVASVFALVAVATMQCLPAWAQRTDASDSNDSANSASVRLKQNSAAASGRELPSSSARSATGGVPAGDAMTAAEAADRRAEPLARYVSGEFEIYVQSKVSPEIVVRRLGADLITGNFDNQGSELSPLVPDDYLISAGDEVLVSLWGSVDADLRLLVDRAGRVTLPRVGAIQVAGLPYRDLKAAIARRVATVFKNFEFNCNFFF